MNQGQDDSIMIKTTQNLNQLNACKETISNEKNLANIMLLLVFFSFCLILQQSKFRILGAVDIIPIMGEERK